MRKITMFMLAFVLTASFSFGQNIIVNGDFETGEINPWGGFKNRILTDDITNSFIGQIENGDGSLFQEFSVTPGETYDVNLEYRWVNTGANNTNLTMRLKDRTGTSGTNDNWNNNLALTGANNSDGYTLDSTLDTWMTASFSITVPAGVDFIRLLMYKGNGNKPLNVDNVSVDQNLSTNDFEQFQFKTYPNPMRDVLNISANTNIERVEMYDILGNQVKKFNLNAQDNQISVSELSRGVYVLKTYIQGNVNSQKIIKK